MKIEIIKHHAVVTDNIDHYLTPGQVLDVDDDFGAELVSSEVAKQIGQTKNKMVEPTKNKGVRK